jgi:hypothetical protein
VACEDSASIDCAREIRGIASIANAVAPVAAIARAPSAFVSGARKPIRTESPLSRELSSGATTFGDHLGLPGIGERRAGLLEQRVRDARGLARAHLHHDGVAAAGQLAHDLRTRATRRSPEAVSLGTPILTGPGTASGDSA